jgi:hypothetical protein
MIIRFLDNTMKKMNLLMKKGLLKKLEEMMVERINELIN